MTQESISANSTNYYTLERHSTYSIVARSDVDFHENNLSSLSPLCMRYTMLLYRIRKCYQSEEKYDIALQWVDEAIAMLLASATTEIRAEHCYKEKPRWMQYNCSGITVHSTYKAAYSDAQNNAIIPL